MTYDYDGQEWVDKTASLRLPITPYLAAWAMYRLKRRRHMVLINQYTVVKSAHDWAMYVLHDAGLQDTSWRSKVVQRILSNWIVWAKHTLHMMEAMGYTHVVYVPRGDKAEP